VEIEITEIIITIIIAIIENNHSRQLFILSKLTG